MRYTAAIVIDNFSPKRRLDNENEERIKLIAIVMRITYTWVEHWSCFFTLATTDMKSGNKIILVMTLFLGASSAMASYAGPKSADPPNYSIAAGQVIKPSASSPTPNITPFNTNPTGGLKGLNKAPALAPIQLFDLFPPSKEPVIEAPPENPRDISPPPVTRGTIEYNEDLNPKSNVPGLSCLQAMREALVHGPRAAAIRAQLAIAVANFPQATVVPNPVFFLDRGLVAEQVNRMGPSLSIEEPYKLVFRLLVAHRLVNQTKVDLLTQIWALRATVRAAFVELVVAQETQKTLEKLFDISNQLYSITAKRFSAGAVPELDVLKARLAAYQASVDVNVGRRRVLRAKQQLNILMGRNADAPLVVSALPDFSDLKSREASRNLRNDILPDFSREVPPLSSFLERALTNRLELKSLALQLKVNKANLYSAYGNVIPNTGFAFGKSTVGNPTAGPKLTAVFFTLNQEMPLVNFQQGLIWQYWATQRQLGYQVAAQRNQVTADVTSAYNDLLAARKKLRVFQEKLLFDSNEVARLSRRSYEVGQSDITSALAAQQANVQIQNSYLDAVNSYASAFTNLELSLGKPLQ